MVGFEEAQEHLRLVNEVRRFGGYEGLITHAKSIVELRELLKKLRGIDMVE